MGACPIFNDSKLDVGTLPYLLPEILSELLSYLGSGEMSSVR